MKFLSFSSKTKYLVKTVYSRKLPKPRAFKGFSLTELSIVLTIIAILITGISQGSNLFSWAKLLSARSYSANAPFLKNDNLALWLDAVQENAFAVGDTSPYATVKNLASNTVVSAWNDQKTSIQNDISPTQPTAANRPKYQTNIINGLPAIVFDGSDTLYTPNISPLQLFSDGQASIFIVQTYKSGNSTPVGWNIGNAQKITISLPNKSSITANFAGDSYTYSSAAEVGNIVSQPMVLVAIKKLNSLSIRANGQNLGLGKSNASSRITANNAAALNVGSWLNGAIGEIIIFRKALSLQEISDIEQYLSNKWKIMLGSTLSNCSMDAGYGYSAKTGLFQGAGSFVCDASYTGTILYNCPSQGGNITASSGSCVLNTCYIGSGTGYSAKANLPQGANQSFPCDTGYEGAVQYTCQQTGGAVINITSNCTPARCSCNGIMINSGSACTTTCASGSSITDYSQLCTNGALSAAPADTCNCKVAANYGYGERYVRGDSSFTCDAGYSGTINYGCVAPYGGTASVSGACLRQCTCIGTPINSGTNCNMPCAIGSGTANYNQLCSDGSLVAIAGNACTCSLPAGTGYAARTNLPQGTGQSLSCDAGYSGTISYTCAAPSGGTASISGTCIAQCNCNGSMINSGATCTTTCASGSNVVSNSKTCNNGSFGAMSGNACTCSLAAGTGYAARTNLPQGTGQSLSCDAGYSGTISYTCAAPSGGTASISGTCTPSSCNKCSQTFASGTSISCNDCPTGYTGNNTYSCNVGNVTTVNNCVPAQCNCNGSMINSGSVCHTNCLGGPAPGYNQTCTNGSLGAITGNCNCSVSSPVESMTFTNTYGSSGGPNAMSAPSTAFIKAAKYSTSYVSYYVDGVSVQSLGNAYQRCKASSMYYFITFNPSDVSDSGALYVNPALASGQVSNIFSRHNNGASAYGAAYCNQGVIRLAFFCNNSASQLCPSMTTLSSPAYNGSGMCPNLLL